MPERIRVKRHPLEMPEVLSDNLYDFQIAMDGQVYKFPMWFDDFEALAGNISVTGQKLLYANEYLYAEPCRRTVLRFILPLQIYLKCHSTGGRADLRDWIWTVIQMRNCDWKIELSKELHLGSLQGKISEGLWEPTDEYDGELYYKMSYETDYYSEVTCMFNKDSGVMEKLELMNMIEL